MDCVNCVEAFLFAKGLSQDLKTGCPKLAIANSLGVLFFKGDHTNYIKDGVLPTGSSLVLLESFGNNN